MGKRKKDPDVKTFHANLSNKSKSAKMIKKKDFFTVQKHFQSFFVILGQNEKKGLM